MYHAIQYIFMSTHKVEAFLKKIELDKLKTMCLCSLFPNFLYESKIY